MNGPGADYRHWMLCPRDQTPALTPRVSAEYTSDGQRVLFWPQSFRPHMERRPGETRQQWHHRLARSCYACGQQFPSPGDALNAHEDTHTHP